MFQEMIGKLIKYETHFWLIDSIQNGEAELWFNGTCVVVPLDDLELDNVVSFNNHI